MLNDTDLTKMVNIIEKKLMEEDTSMDFGSSLLKMSMGDESEDIIDSFETARSWMNWTALDVKRPRQRP